MSLREYLVERDWFEDDGRSILCFPCRYCKHRNMPPDVEPCRTCDHNESAKPDEPAKEGT
jgi:hypothetical protein